MKSFLLLNGPNLNLLGKRETDIYGEQTLEQIEEELLEVAKKNKIDLKTFQSNAEHELVDRIQAGKNEIVSCILFNPGAKDFVSVGDKISEGDVLCIIEAMKMMNEVKADSSGTIKQVLIENCLLYTSQSPRDCQ